MHSKKRLRNLGLLVALLVLFLVSPFIVPLRFGVVIFEVIGALVLFAGTFAVSERTSSFVVAIALAAISIVANFLLIVWQNDWLILFSYSSVLVLLVLFSVDILRSVLRRGQVTADKICGALCVYLLAAYAWTFAYALMDLKEPESFNGLSGTARDHVSRVIQLRYFSFVTLTTVGYGDITPRSSVARTFANLEAVIGQIYLAVLVARLVSLHIVHEGAKQEKEKPLSE